MMMMFISIIILIYHINSGFAQNPILGLQVKITPKIEELDELNVLSREDNSITVLPSRRPTESHSISRTTPTQNTYASPLPNSNCFCSYDQIINLLLCSPLLQTSTSYPLSDTNTSLINITLNDCIFSTNHLNLPMIQRKNIDQLRLYNVNHRNYLVLDGSSFSSYSINNLFVVYSYTLPITMLLISNDTFSLSSINLSLRTLYISSCYIVTLNKPFTRLFLLESISLINIYQFSWYDFQQQIVLLPKLQTIYIVDEIFSLTGDIFNAISCQDLSSQWTFTYRSLQTCSCKYISFLQTMHRLPNSYKCPNSNNAIDFMDDICQFKEKEYQIQDEPNLFCNRCLTFPCPNGTLCAEVYDSEPVCVPLSRYDYETISNRIPLTPYTQPFLFRESQQFLSSNANRTLGPTAFNSVANVLIDSNRNNLQNSQNDAQMFHQTFSEMLDRPWSPTVFSSPNTSSGVWQQLLVSLDGSIKNLNDSEPKFVFQSKPISTMSLPFLPEQHSQGTYGWKITHDNQITENITDSQSNDINVTTRVFLKFNIKQQNMPMCNSSNTNENCTNRFSITSLKSPKLFYNTNRIPQYDVISILAPSPNQTVTFYFDQKLDLTNTSDSPINTTTTNSSISDSFYDQLDIMISEGTCMYLNMTSMVWQTDGCITDRQLSNNISVICTCEHLTMFTVFFSLTCATPSQALEVLSWIGCIISIVSLLAILVMFIVTSQCRKPKDSANGMPSSSQSSSSQELRRRIMSKPRRFSITKAMLFILCILLILMNILIFILTFIKSGRNLTCTILAASLYYFTLTAFIWKFCFALQQSLFITNIFQPIWSDRTLFIIYFIITFSIPICPLMIMFIKYEDSVFISSTCNYCWLTREFLLYGLIIPILVILCFNIMFYLYTMIHLCVRNRQQPGLRSTKSDHSRRTQNFKIGLFFAIIMGFSWIIGFLLLIPNSYVQYIGNILFCIVNTLQGFAFSIMVFCMLEKKSFRKCFCFWRYKKPTNTATKSPNVIPQESLPTSNDDNDAKNKNIYNSSIYTSSTTSDIDNTKKLPTEKEDNDQEHIYSSPTF
ncbi:unnamed protein product [Adineta steineri]|uniref:G-protein coupled receptors family 2 profile 2 domain-containing protein n=1 Tax=Adineta steineri TaxID=433720 RepID=A0A818GFH6_9BILA|nr:unnamed protein product [Adineta steineri]CAF3490965.1 unnamed protein product [Adineta steineri]